MQYIIYDRDCRKSLKSLDITVYHILMVRYCKKSFYID